MNKNLCINIVYLVIFILSLNARADWLPEKSASYHIVNSHAEVTVDKNGIYTAITDYEIKALNDDGRNKLVMRTIPFVPDAMSMQILKASSVTDGIVTPVNLKTIQKRTAQGDSTGINSNQELVIPFTNIKVGSSIRYTVKTTQTKNLVKGLFSMQFVFGVSEPELKGSARITSQIPLYVAVNDPWQVIQHTQSKKNKKYVFEMKQIKPLFKVPAELNPVIRKEIVSAIEVTTMNNWQDYAKSMSVRYEEILKNKKLPPALESIAVKAETGKSIREKINIVTSELANVMTYSGDWSSFDKMYFPKSLSAVSLSKTGDCKDFSLATTAILRRLGLEAYIAVTERKVPTALGIATMDRLNKDYVVPTFNHAIVKVRHHEGALWIDPTNVVSSAGYVFSDIAGSNALEISEKATRLEVIPYPEPSQNKVVFTKDLKINDDHTVDSTTRFEMTGSFAKYVLETSLVRNEDDGKKVLMRFLGTDSNSAKSFYKDVDFKSRVADVIKGEQSTISEKIVAEKDQKILLIVPVPLSLQSYLSIPDRRKSDLNLETMFSEDSITIVKGYDFVGMQSGCVSYYPWFDIHRTLVKIENGFEVRNKIETKLVEISAEKVNSDEFQMSLDDVRSCASQQVLEIRKIAPGETLGSRLKDYTIEKAEELMETQGPKSVSASEEAYHIVNQILNRDPSNMEARLIVVRALRKVGFKNNLVPRTVYSMVADKILDQLINDFPNDPAVLRRKTYRSIERGQKKEIVDNFNSVYNATTNKDYNFYFLGGVVAEALSKSKAAVGSYQKALDLATTNVQKAKANSAIGDIFIEGKDYETAIKFYRASLSFSPENTWLQGSVVSYLGLLKKWDEAIVEGEKMLQTSTYGVGRRMVAKAYVNKVKALYEEIRGHKSSLPATKQKLAEIESNLMKGLRHDSGNGDCLYQMGMLYLIHAKDSKDPATAQKGLDYLERSEKSSDWNPQTAQQISEAKLKLSNIISGQSSVNRYPADDRSR